jgi:hypothetical protein
MRGRLESKNYGSFGEGAMLVKVSVAPVRESHIPGEIQLIQLRNALLDLEKFTS